MFELIERKVLRSHRVDLEKFSGVDFEVFLVRLWDRSSSMYGVTFCYTSENLARAGYSAIVSASERAI